MAFASTQTTQTTPLSGITALPRRIAARYRAYRLYRETFDGLNALGNRELNDLGLSRSDLRRIATEAAYT